MPPEAKGPTVSLAPIKKSAWSYDHARHLLLRAGFGGSPHQYRLLAEWGPEKSVDHLLNFEQVKGYPNVSPDEFRSDIMAPLSAADRAEVARARRAQDEDTLARFREERQNRERLDREQVRAMQKWWLKRMIETPRPFEEKMALFWHGHFATSYRTIENSWHQLLQNQLFRRHGASSYEDLLRGIVRDPAMLKYLDNDESRKERPNENLAREIMELFALGVGAYGEKDIKEGARALTGYSFEYNDFVFRRERHDTTNKSILGRQGAFDGDDFVSIILQQPACAGFIAGKVYRFLVNDLAGDTAPGTPGARPHQQVIQTLAAELSSSNYKLRPMLRTLLLSEHFYDPANRHARIKGPVELVVGMVRSLRTPVRDLGILCDALDLMGQNLFFPPNVAGWAGGRSWINTSTVFVRQNIANFLISGKMPKGFDPLADLDRYDPTALLADLAQVSPGSEKDPKAVATYLLRFVLGTEAVEPRLKVLVETMEGAGGVNAESVTAALCLITTMPEFQVC
ncbi:MAG: DUF1800 domain-containing protein [Planctomycetes bacterium]|nr:DUF1800 domain-containing protein [Planctomycetota bacterium]